MSSTVFPGRYTAALKDPVLKDPALKGPAGQGDPAGRDVGARDEVTVFLIGMRANRWWKLGRIAQVTSAMPKMLAHLSRTPEAGMLGFHTWFGRTTIILSYWESPEHLNRFAADREAPHLEPWRRFMKELAGSGDVGVWHETYRVRAGDFETVYSDMPRFGLAAAAQHVPVGRGTGTARERMRHGAPTPGSTAP
ncbi:DUF4188 domain-containing protein [Arthrobacter woluwensis]|uniref:DUF4188 domain-containing protein n=1 Tax=Arthrobacter woluwensis TaxID=156980 RepID=UPI000D119D90|nr:DUF4188 domain-containing protein [Arthrobacter woluwensis]